MIAPLGGFATAMGNGEAVMRDAKRGVNFAGSDPRTDGAAIPAAAARAAAQRAALDLPAQSGSPLPRARTAPDATDLAFTNFLQFQVHRNPSAHVYIE